MSKKLILKTIVSALFTISYGVLIFRILFLGVDSNIFQGKIWLDTVYPFILLETRADFMAWICIAMCMIWMIMLFVSREKNKLISFFLMIFYFEIMFYGASSVGEDGFYWIFVIIGALNAYVEFKQLMRNDKPETKEVSV